MESQLQIFSLGYIIDNNYGNSHTTNLASTIIHEE